MAENYLNPESIQNKQKIEIEINSNLLKQIEGLSSLFKLTPEKLIVRSIEKELKWIERGVDTDFQGIYESLIDIAGMKKSIKKIFE